MPLRRDSAHLLRRARAVEPRSTRPRRGLHRNSGRAGDPGHHALLRTPRRRARRHDADRIRRPGGCGAPRLGAGGRRPVRPGLGAAVRGPLPVREEVPRLLSQRRPSPGGATLDPREGHWTRLSTAAVLGLFLAGCGGNGSPQPSPSASVPAGSCGAGTPVPGTPSLTTQRVVGGLNSPVDLQVPPGDHARLFVVEQAGRIRIIRNGAIAATFLDIVSRVGSGGERGLLGLAFHPRYAENGRFFVNYTDRSGDTHVSEFRASPGSDAADAGSERELLFVRQPFANHNGGRLAFGNDGKLYIGLGDGGSGGDPFRNGQNLATPLGKMLRIDVDAGTPFAVPSDNPFVSTAGAFPAIWAYGLRN